MLTSKRTVKSLEWILSNGVVDPCASCAAGKAKQNQIPKVFTCVKAGVPGGQYGYAISTQSMILMLQNHPRSNFIYKGMMQLGGASPPSTRKVQMQ